LSSVEYFISC